MTSRGTDEEPAALLQPIEHSDAKTIASASDYEEKQR
jgi:hypothetical protein